MSLRVTPDLTIVRTTLDRVALHPESPEVPALIDKALNYLAISDKAWQQYAPLPRSADEEALYGAVASARQAFVQQAILPFVDAMKKGDRTTADTLTMTTIPPLSAALTKASNALDDYQRTQGKASFETEQDRFMTLSWIGGVLIVLGLVSCVGCAFSLQRAIARPLAQILAHFTRIAEGDLTGRIETRSQDEMGELVKGLQTMQRSLTDTVRNVTDIMNEIAAASNEQSDGIEQVNRAVSQMDEVSQQNAALVEQAAAAAASLEEQADGLRRAVSTFQLAQ